MTTIDDGVRRTTNRQIMPRDGDTIHRTDRYVILMSTSNHRLSLVWLILRPPKIHYKHTVSTMMVNTKILYIPVLQYTY